MLIGDYVTTLIMHNLEIVVDDLKDVYTNNDVILGKVVASSSGPLNVQGIYVRLKCRETATVENPIMTTATDFMDFCTIEHTLFPLPDVMSASSYTLKPGTHSYPFEFRVPTYSPELHSTCNFSEKSGIYWYVEAVAPTPGVSLGTGFHDLRRLWVTQTLPEYKPHGNNVLSIDHKVSLGSKTSKLKNMLGRGNTQTVHMYGKVPRAGLPQRWNHSAFAFGLKSEQGAQLVVTKFRCVLKQVNELYLGTPTSAEYVRRDIPVVEITGVHWGLKEGLDKIETALHKARLREPLPPTRHSGFIDTQYKAHMAVTLTNAESTSQEEVAIDVPIAILDMAPTSDKAPPAYTH